MEEEKLREYLTKQSIIAYRESIIEECAQIAKKRFESNDYPSDPELGEEVYNLICALKDK